MIIARLKQHCKLIALLFLSLLFFSFILIPSNANAEYKDDKGIWHDTIKKKEMEKVATFDRHRANSNQGGTITPDYFIYADCTKHGKVGCTIHIRSRSTCKNLKSLRTDNDKKVKNRWVHGVNARWGEKYANLMHSKIGYESDGDMYAIPPKKIRCIKLDGKNSKFVTAKGNCKKLDNHGYAKVNGKSKQKQGTPANFNGYIFKISGKTGKKERPIIHVYKKGRKRPVALIKLPIKANYEPEGVTIDGETGEIYVIYDKHGAKKVVFFKLNAPRLSRYTGKYVKSSPPHCKENKITKKGTVPGTVETTTGSESSGSSGSSDSSGQDDTANNTVNTSLFGTIEDDGQGCGIYSVLNLVIDILTYGIAIAAAIGIAIFGIQYLTAGGNEERAFKAKRRLFEIVVGLALYATAWAGLNWLLPGGKINPNSACSNSSIEDGSDEEDSEDLIDDTPEEEDVDVYVDETDETDEDDTEDISESDTIDYDDDESEPEE